MSRQISPFAALTGAEKQIRWLEYQSIRLPYIQLEEPCSAAAETKQEEIPAKPVSAPPPERPQPPPEVPRTMPVAADFQRSRHSQYDAVIARMKQAELQTRRQTPL